MIKKIEFEITNDVVWNDYGETVIAFKKGDVASGDLYPDGIIRAESPHFHGWYEAIPNSDIKMKG